jgi:hypothetical protein
MSGQHQVPDLSWHSGAGQMPDSARQRRIIRPFKDNRRQLQPGDFNPPHEATRRQGPFHADLRDLPLIDLAVPLHLIVFSPAP